MKSSIHKWYAAHPLRDMHFITVTVAKLMECDPNTVHCYFGYDIKSQKNTLHIQIGEHSIGTGISAREDTFSKNEVEYQILTPICTLFKKKINEQ